MKKSALVVRSLLLCGLLLAALPGCSSSSNSVGTSHLEECKCGTPDYDVFGCRSACSLGKATCDNPLCTCETPATSQPTK